MSSVVDEARANRNPCFGPISGLWSPITNPWVDLNRDIAETASRFNAAKIEISHEPNNAHFE